jgi:hypothetical protein
LKELFGINKKHHDDDDGLQQQQQQELAGLDITIDDQALVYISLPTPIFLNHPCIYDTPAMKQTCDSLKSQMVFGKNILSRIIDPSMDELLWVLQRLNNQIDAQFFASRIRDDDDDDEEDDDLDDYDDDDSNNMSKKKKTQSTEKMKPRTTQDDLIDAVEYVIQSKNDEGITNVLPERVDLFVVESIFRPRPLSLISRFAVEEYNNNTYNRNVTETSSALEAAQTTIQSFAVDSKTYPTTAPISWGNTNTRPREFITALQAAEMSQRPVQFIIYGGLEACDTIRNCTFQLDDDLKLCLPKSSRLTLLQRNIRRFVETGRYIPSSAIADAIERVNSMIATAVDEANKEENDASSSSSCEVTNDAKFRLDYELAKLAGYHLHANRTVSSLSPPDNNNHRGNYHSSGGRDNSNNVGRGRNNNGGRNNNNSHRGRGQNNQDYQRRRDQKSRGGGGSGRGGRSYTQGHPAPGRGYNQGGESYRSQHGGRGGSYNSQGRGRGGSSSYHHQGGRYPNQGYGGRNSNQYGDSRMDDRSEPRGNSSQYNQRSRGNEQYGRGGR